MPPSKKRRARVALDVVVAGHIYCDLIFADLPAPPVLGEEVRTQRFTLTVGGGALITAVGLSRLGVKTGLRGYVGRDVLGQFQLDTLRRERLDVSQVARHPRLSSAVTVAFSTATDRAFVSYSGCAADVGRLLRWRDAPALARSHHVHFSGIPAPFEERLPLLDRLAAAHVTTSLDIGWNPAVFEVPAFRDVIRRVTIFMPSWRDAQRLTGRSTPEDAARALGEMVPMPVVKLGADGAIALDRGRLVRVRPPRVHVLETTGAGDAFNAGFLWAYLRGEPLQRCLWAGNLCGALSTRAAGGIAAFPRRREVMTLMRGGSPIERAGGR